MIFFIYNVLFLKLFINGPVVAAIELSNVPMIYPRRESIIVDAHTDLVLGCRGAEPLRWTIRDDVNGLKNITFINNTNELDYKFETMLITYNVSHVNVGFYYCHGEKTDFDTPIRSERIYVYVQDDNNLSVITSQEYKIDHESWIMHFPCKPTSPDIDITVTCDNFLKMSVNPSNYSKLQHAENYTIRFHPYEGFTAQGDLFIHFDKCDCSFRRKNNTFHLSLKAVYYSNNYFIPQLLIEGSDTVNVGDNITLQCSGLVELYYPHTKYGLHWNAPSSGTYVVINHYSYKLKQHILHISVLTITNISSEDEGNYQCYVKLDDLIAYKYVTVHDKKVSHRSPRIYSPGPDQQEIQVNSGENITLLCKGYRPVTWSWDEKNINERITYTGNGLYNAYLYLTQVRFTNTGFYYCHENDTIKEHPLKSRNIFIFVKDEQNLHMPQAQKPHSSFAYENGTVPCRATSLDVNVSISMVHRNYIKSTGKNSPGRSFTPAYAYDPRKGFTFQMPQSGMLTATCTFVTETNNSTLAFMYFIGEFNSEPQINSPPENLVFVGETLELSCIVPVRHYVPDNVLHWIVPNNSSSYDIIFKSFNVSHGKVFISKLFINNIRNIDEGRYTCYLSYNNATASKFISVFDKFKMNPFVENLTYHYAYIGQPLDLRCGVNVSHNIEFNMKWTTPNTTETHMKIMNTEYILEVRHRKGEIILEIDNVTYENEGNYSCYVSDLTNRKENVTKYVQVKRGKTPTMKTAIRHLHIPEDFDVLIGETAKLTCPADGDPKPTITWMKRSTRVQKLVQHIDFSADNSELTIFFVQRNDDGLYTCIARNPYGQVSHVVHLRVKTASVTGIMITVIIFMSILVITVAVAFAKFERNKKRRRRELLEAGLVNYKFGEAEKEALSDYDTKWEIPRNYIQLGRNLGSGYFGLVVEATVSNYFSEEADKTVAVKMLHKNYSFTELNSLISELKILTNLGKHVNLINLLGACTKNIAESNLLVVIEYCKYGSLRNYLIENRSHFMNLINPETDLICIANVEDVEGSTGDSGPVELQQVTTLELLRWALQVAHGMEFLTSRKVLHGDLAARNVLLAENYVVKISDFGLSRNMNSNNYYRKKSQCSLPVKWMALESICDKTFSTWSDVWSFGVVLWELFSLARTPYAEMEPDLRFYKKLESGYRLNQPEYATKEIYQVMRECWCAQPQLRPTFLRLVDTLNDLLEDVHMRCIGFGVPQHHNVNVSTECFTATSSDRENTAAQEWIALDVMTLKESCSNK